MALAHPEAEGWGNDTRHAFAGMTDPTIIRVTNLNTSGPGSFKDAVEASGPRIVVFEVSGVVIGAGVINISNPYLWIAGQTAPNPGFRLRGAEIVITADHVLMQHISVGRGDDPFTVGSCITLSGTDRVFVEYCNAYFATGPSIQMMDGTTKSTFSHILIGEPLDATWGSLGGQITRNSTDIINDVTFHHNLFVHSKARNLHARYQQRSEIAMNVFYNMDAADGSNHDLRDLDSVDKTLLVDMWSNTFRDGAGSATSWMINCGTAALAPGSASKLYMGIAQATGNVHWDKRASDNTDLVWNVVEDVFLPAGTFQSLTPTLASSGTLLEMSPSEVYTDIVTNKNVGSRPLTADALRDRMVSEVIAKSGVWKDDIAAAGGWPAITGATRVFNTPANPFADSDNDGYFNIERYIHENYTVEVQPFTYEFPPLPDVGEVSTSFAKVKGCGRRYKILNLFDNNGNVIGTQYVDGRDNTIVTDAGLIAKLSDCRK